MENINKEFQEVINKHLPSAVGDELKSVLEQGKEDALKVVVLEKELDYLQKNELKRRKELDDAILKLSSHKDLDKRMIELEEKERNLKISALNVELSAEKRISSTLISTLSGLVRNTEYRTSAMVNLPYTNSSNGNTTTSYNPTKDDKTQTAV